MLVVSHGGDMAGAQRTLLTLLTAIDRRRFEPYLVVPNAGALSSAAEKLGIPVFVRHLVHWLPGAHTVPRRRRFRHLVKSGGTLRARSWAIAHLILRNEIDLVYTNTATCVEGAIAARMTGRPHVWHIHEPVLNNSELRPVLPFSVYSWSIGMLSDSVIFCSDVLAKCYPALTRKAVVVHNGLPFSALPDRARARRLVEQHLGIGPNRKIVAVIGVLQPRKDHLTFLAAAQQVLKSVGEVTFLIVGSGTDMYTEVIRNEINSLGLASSVNLTGWWPEEQFGDLLAAIDVLVISSEQESFGLTAIEALAMETPVVATRCGGPEEVIEHGRTGLLVPVRDPVAMSEAIVRLLQDPELARALGVAGNQDVRARFSVDRYVSGIEEVLRRATASTEDALVST